MLNETPRSEQVVETRLPFEPEMLLIPAGRFLMGGDPADAPRFDDAEAENAYAGGWGTPGHMVYLSDYCLARTPITNAQYAAFLQDASHPRPKRWRSDRAPKGKEGFPVVYVSWHDAVAYCCWLAEASAKPYRVPSEAEWEKGASWDQAITTGAGRPSTGEGALWGGKRRYPWGDAWAPGRANTAEAELNGITPVDACPQGASPYGLLDMAGNVWEWTSSLWGTDWYQPQFAYPYDAADGRENLDAGEDVCRVLRGGSFAYTERLSRCAYRYKNLPRNASDGIGFRVALKQG